MSIISLLIFIVLVGVVMWLVNLIPMPGPIKALLNLVVLVVLVIYVLQWFGVIHGVIPMPSVPVHLDKG